MRGERILIVGGYGQVGRLVSERLAHMFPGRVTVAGRDEHKAAAAVAAIGYGAKSCAFDIQTPLAPDVLEQMALVLVCLDQTDTRFVAGCLASGVHYVDISADERFLSAVEELHPVALRSGAAATLSVGVAPGLTNLLARRGCQSFDVVERVELLVELALGDQHGRAAVEWMLENLGASYDVWDNGALIAVRSFGEWIALPMPGQRPKRRAYRFNFPAQHVVARTMDIPSVSSWFRLTSPAATWVLAFAARVGLGRLLRRPRWRRWAARALMHLRIGKDTCAVAARVTGRRRDGIGTVTHFARGRGEALMTAVVAAETVRQCLNGAAVPGVYHSHDVVALEPVVAALSAAVPEFVVGSL